MNGYIEQKIIELQNSKTATEITQNAKYFINILAENERLTKQLEKPCKVGAKKEINATNADRIRSMSDKELAEYIFDLGNGSEYCYGHCAYQDDCATKGLDHDTCIKGVIDWLKQPAKED